MKHEHTQHRNDSLHAVSPTSFHGSHQPGAHSTLPLQSSLQPQGQLSFIFVFTFFSSHAFGLHRTMVVLPTYPTMLQQCKCPVSELPHDVAQVPPPHEAMGTHPRLARPCKHLAHTAACKSLPCHVITPHCLGTTCHHSSHVPLPHILHHHGMQVLGTPCHTCHVHTWLTLGCLFPFLHSSYPPLLLLVSPTCTSRLC
jgi:hypothetical protein